MSGTLPHTTLSELASQVRSKNAGPFWMTIDVFFDTAEDYERGVNSPLTDKASIAAHYAADPTAVSIFLLPHLRAIKVSLPRPAAQGSLADCDMHAGQQFVPLLVLSIA